MMVIHVRQHDFINGWWSSWVL